MGYIFLVKGKHPAFLTISKLNALLKELRSSGKCPEANSAEELFGGKSIDTANKAIIEYLKEFEKRDSIEYFERYYEFHCYGEEAKDNLFYLLDAGAVVHKFPGFRSERNNIDIRFPYGKEYYYVVSAHKNSTIEILINTDRLVEFYGNLLCFTVVFRDYSLFVDHGSVTVCNTCESEAKSYNHSNSGVIENNSTFIDYETDKATQSMSLEEDDDISTIICVLSELFEYYQNIHRYHEIEQKRIQTINAVRAFSGHNSFDSISLTLELRIDDECRYLSFSITEEELTVTDAGHVYNRDIGGDSYTNWSYTLWNDGTRDGFLFLDIKSIRELIDEGAHLDIECYSD